MTTKPMDRVEILRLIVGRSRKAARAADQAIRAIQGDAPTADRRCRTAVVQALDDPSAEFSDEEQKLLATLMGAPLLEDVRGLNLRLRVSKLERQQVEQAATDAGLSVGNYIRRQLGLPLVE